MQEPRFSINKLGKYEIKGELGRGGMGVVYKGHDPHIDRPVAIKVISESALVIPEVKARFQREARTAGKLSHPNIATVYDLGEIDDKMYIVMEYLPGDDLRDIIDNKVALTIEQKLEIMRQTCEALHHAHNNKVIHRDVKPDNVKVLDDGRVKVIDFGIAKPDVSVTPKDGVRPITALTHVGMRIGTPWYMSPEQVKGETVDNRSDIFSFGVVLYEFLTYTKPFTGDDTTVLYKILHEEPAEIDLDESWLVEDLQNLLTRCLAKNPDDRFGSCGEILEELSGLLHKSEHEKEIMELLSEAYTSAESKDFEEALSKVDQVLQINPTHSEAKAYRKSLMEREKESATIRILTGKIVGDVVSHYRITERLGGGGMGVVYKAEDILLKRSVALKFLLPELTRNDKAKQRFLKEAQAASALDHPNICTIHEISETEGGLMFICMAFCPGQNLGAKIDAGDMDIVTALDIAVQIAKGLARAHERGIVHRDIKPLNIIVSDRNTVKIVDFGLAKLSGGTKITKTGMTMGTIPYMSPEQIGGKELDARSDIWALGVLIYELVTKKLPFQSDYEAALLYSIMNTDPIPASKANPDVPGRLERIVTKTLKKDKEQRYQTMNELLDALVSLRDQMSEDERQHIEMATKVGKLVDSGRTKIESQHYTDALAQLEKAKNLDPDNEEVRGLIDLAAKKKQDIQTIEQLLADAKSLQESGQIQEALAKYDEIIALDPDNEAARAAVAKKESEPARTLLIEDYHAEPTDAEPEKRTSGTDAGGRGKKRSLKPVAATAAVIAVAAVAVLGVRNGWFGGGAGKVSVTVTADADCKLRVGDGAEMDLVANQAATLSLAAGNHQIEVLPRDYPIFATPVQVAAEATAPIRHRIDIVSRFDDAESITLTVNAFYDGNTQRRVTEPLIINGYSRALDRVGNFKQSFPKGVYDIRFDLSDAQFIGDGLLSSSDKAVVRLAEHRFDFSNHPNSSARVSFNYSAGGSTE